MRETYGVDSRGNLYEPNVDPGDVLTTAIWFDGYQWCAIDTVEDRAGEENIIVRFDDLIDAINHAAARMEKRQQSLSDLRD